MSELFINDKDLTLLLLKWRGAGRAWGGGY